MGNKNKKLFNQAYDKATLISPGGKNSLSAEEQEELLSRLYKDPFRVVACQVCGKETHDKDRTHRFLTGIRVCGPCLHGKDPEGWKG